MSKVDRFSSDISSQETAPYGLRMPGVLSNVRALTAATVLGIASLSGTAEAKDSSCPSLQGGAKAACNACETDGGTFANFQCTKPVFEIAEAKPAKPKAEGKKKPKVEKPTKKPTPANETTVAQNETCTPDPESADHDMLNKKLNVAIGLSGLSSGLLALLAVLGLRRRKEEKPVQTQAGNDVY